MEYMLFAVDLCISPKQQYTSCVCISQLSTACPYASEDQLSATFGPTLLAMLLTSVVLLKIYALSLVYFLFFIFYPGLAIECTGK